MRTVYKIALGAAFAAAVSAAVYFLGDSALNKEVERLNRVAENTHREYVAPQEKAARKKMYEELARKTKE